MIHLACVHPEAPVRHLQFPIRKGGFLVLARKSMACVEAYKNSSLREVSPKIDTARAEKERFRTEVNIGSYPGLTRRMGRGAAGLSPTSQPKITVVNQIFFYSYTYGKSIISG